MISKYLDARARGLIALGAAVILSTVGTATGCATSTPNSSKSTVPSKVHDEVVAGCDSNTSGAHNIRNLTMWSYVDVLQARGVVVHDVGLDGSALASGAAERMLAKVDERLATSTAPEDLTVLLMCGSNDILRGRSASDLVGDVLELVASLDERGVQTPVVSIPHVGGAGDTIDTTRNVRIQETNRILSEAFGDRFLDVSNNAQMTVLGVDGARNVLRYDRHVGDGLHLNSAAHDVLAAEIETRLVELESLGPDPTIPDPTAPDPTIPDPTVPDPTIPDPTIPDEPPL